MSRAFHIYSHSNIPLEMFDTETNSVCLSGSHTRTHTLYCPFIWKIWHLIKEGMLMRTVVMHHMRVLHAPPMYRLLSLCRSGWTHSTGLFAINVDLKDTCSQPPVFDS